MKRWLRRLTRLVVRKRQAREWLVFGLFIISFGCLGLGLFLMLAPTAPIAVRAPHGSNVSAHSTEPAPSSVKPAPQAVANYVVAPTLPKYIAIPSIGLNQTRIQQLGLTADDAVGAPSNIYDAGWYNGSSLPGQSGAMFIDGHVSSWTAYGAFYNLKKLKAGDEIRITRGDNKLYVYQVVTVKSYPYNAVDMQSALAPINANKPGLNLMTCTGQVMKGTSEFDHRLVVYTVLMS